MTYHRNKSESWTAKMNRRRGERAVERQLEYQRVKARDMSGHEKITALSIKRRAVAIRRKIEEYRKLRTDDRILEVGSGAHGLIFGFEEHFAVGIDPLAVEYKSLFPVWQGQSETIAGIGESLPFGDDSFDVVLSDNVVDHAADPVKIMRELTRVLRPSGILYFTVNTHHPIYHAVSVFHGYWNALGIKFEISPFADHTVHFTQEAVSSVFKDLPVNVVSECAPHGDGGGASFHGAGLEGKIKRIFKKNILFEVIATKSETH